MSRINKGVLGNILSQMSPKERKLLLIMGLLQNAAIPTKGEREIREYIRGRKNRFDLERYAAMEGVDKLKVKKALIMLSKRNNNEIINAISKMNSLGLTKQEMLVAVNQLRKRAKLAKISEPALADGEDKTNPQKYAIITCDSCDFTTDALKDLEDSKLVCPRCGGDMIGITREDFHTKTREDGFNDGTELIDVTEEKKKTPNIDRDSGM